MFDLRDKEMAGKLIEKIKESGVSATFMHVCGTHQDALMRYGIDTLLEDTGIKIIQGPGCPVCVTTPMEIEEALVLADNGYTLAMFGDMVRVPGQSRSLSDARAEGGDVNIVYSVTDAVDLARENPDKQVIFMGIGFETTAPSSAYSLLHDPPPNYSVLSCHRTVPNALRALIEMGEVRLNGLIQPGHVSAIIGSEPYQFLSNEYNVPQVIAGFEPLDLLMGIYMLIRQIDEGRAELENEYDRIVKKEGNPKAQEMMSRAFVESDVKWRGFPMIKGSGLEICPELDEHNARKVYQDILAPVYDMEFHELPGCRCGEVLRGLMNPEDCDQFAKGCTPTTPIGPCMVSYEGGCTIAYKYRNRKT